LRNDYANSAKWKLAWIKENLTPQPAEIFITPNKEQHAVNADGSPNILIDDRPINIQNWESKGGYGILYQANKDPLSKIEQGLKKGETRLKRLFCDSYILKVKAFII
jgi:5'(3')-deoxyribonucleotidase